jgi:sporulation protein YlmC with PRC-barrel domain
MIRTLLTTTALVTLLSTGAIAQTAPAAPAAGDAQTTTETETTEMESVEVEVVQSPAATTQAGVRTGDLLTQGYMFETTDNIATRMIGSPVYSSAADGADNIGDISDLVLGQDGNVRAVIIGVGGFLGIGQKLVAVDYGMVEHIIAADNTERYVVAVSREQLEAAPDFQWPEERMATDMRQPAGQAPATGAAAPAAGTQPAARPMSAFDPAGTTPIDRTTLTADELTGTDVYGTNNEHIGSIGDFVLGTDDTIDAVVIDFGGFLGIGVKQVAVAYENLNFVADAAGNRSLVLPITREQMEAAPEFDRNTYETQRQNQRLVLQ